MPDHRRRERLIARIRGLPIEKLGDIERLLATLECGDSSPLLPALECGDSSPLLPLECGDSSPLLPGDTSPPIASLHAAGPITITKSGNELPHSKGVTKSGDESPHSICVTKSGNELPHSKDWPHAPLHRLDEQGTYIVTAGTLHKEHLFRGPERLDLLESALLRIAKRAGWHLEAWAVFSNHYHFVAHGGDNLREFLKQLHGETAHDLNRLDCTPGRTVWHNFWDTSLTYEKSYLARLAYVHQNAVRHGLVSVANQYPWCSAAWFERTASRAQVQTIYSFKTDKVRVQDDFEPL